MTEIKIVDVDSLGIGKKPHVYTPFIEAALAMESGKAVVVDLTGRANLLSCVRQAVSSRGLNDKLQVKNRGEMVYILHREAA